MRDFAPAVVGSAHRKQRRTASTLIKAHQRIVRERLAAADPQAHMPDIATATVREIPLSQAKALIETYEWLGTMPPSRFAFDIFFGDRRVGTVLYGDEYAENLDVWEVSERPALPR